MKIFQPQTLQEFWQIAAVILSFFSLIIAVLGIFFIVSQIKHAKNQLAKTERNLELLQVSEIYMLFKTVMEMWSEHYKIRNSLLKKKPVSLENLYKKYKEPADLLITTEWREKIRPLLNFYEFLGVILDNQSLNQEDVRQHIFVLVTVDTYPNGEAKITEGDMYKRLFPYIEYLRKEYREDIYEYYDDILLGEYIKYSKKIKKNNALTEV